MRIRMVKLIGIRDNGQVFLKDEENQELITGHIPQECEKIVRELVKNHWEKLGGKNK